MAKHYSFVAEILRGSIGMTNYYNLAGQSIARRKVAFAPTTKSDKQKVQREKFRLAILMSRILRYVHEIGFTELSNKLPSFNAFVKANLKNVVVDENFEGKIDLPLLQLTNDQDKKPTVNLSYSNNIIRITNTAELVAFGTRSDDKVFVVFYEADYIDVHINQSMTRGQNGSSSFSLPPKWKIENVFAYTFTVSANGKTTSPTVFLPIEIEDGQ